MQTTEQVVLSCSNNTFLRYSSLWVIHAHASYNLITFLEHVQLGYS